jgi:competence protein ComEC
LIRTAKDAFLVKEWLAADADARVPADPSLPEGISCDEAGCVAEMADGALVALALRAEALVDDCERAALVVTTTQAPTSCSAPVIDLGHLRRQGTMDLRRAPDGFLVESVRPRGFDRPWSPALNGNDDYATLLTRPLAKRVDATPSEADLQADE